MKRVSICKWQSINLQRGLVTITVRRINVEENFNANVIMYDASFSQVRACFEGPALM